MSKLNMKWLENMMTVPFGGCSQQQQTRSIASPGEPRSLYEQTKKVFNTPASQSCIWGAVGLDLDESASEPGAHTGFNVRSEYIQKEYQRLLAVLGRMAAATSVCNLGLLYMRPIQIWLKTQVTKKAWKIGRARVVVTHRCLNALKPWRNPDLYQHGAQMGMVTWRKVMTLDRGAHCDGVPVSGDWTVGESMAHKSPRAEGSIFSPSEFHHASTGDALYVLIRMDNMLVVSYINRQGVVHSGALYRQAASLLLWADHHLLSI